jgi:peptide/nickel transport system ATP-binding protein
MVFQDPLLALNPALRVRDQVYEAIRAHSPLSRRETAGRIEPLLQLVGLTASRRLYDAYPHRLSGGERQRVAIALALACRPPLVVADEPFTALDLPRVLELSALFRGLTEKLGVSFLLIDHSPGVAWRIADQALVMYAGQIVERGTPREVIGSPSHPYTAALLKSMPSSAVLRGGSRLAASRRFSIPGNPPGLAARPPGCPFEPRCGDRMPRCAAEAPGERWVEGSRFARCFKYGA